MRSYFDRIFSIKIINVTKCNLLQEDFLIPKKHKVNSFRNSSRDSLSDVEHSTSTGKRKDDRNYQNSSDNATDNDDKQLDLDTSTFNQRKKEKVIFIIAND